MMIPYAYKNNKKRPGTTLLEILIAIIIMGVVLAVISPVFRAYYTTYRIVLAKNKLSNDALHVIATFKKRIRSSSEWRRVGGVTGNTYEFDEITTYSIPPKKEDFLNAVNKTTRMLKYDPTTHTLRWYDNKNNDTSIMLAENVLSFTMKEPYDPDWVNPLGPYYNRVHFVIRLEKKVYTEETKEITTQLNIESELCLRAAAAGPQIPMS